MPVQTQLQQRRGTAASWTSTNPTLAAGEIGFETDTNKFKIGTGSAAWVSLAYASNVSPLTTKGDLYAFSTTNARLPVGANGDTIVADSSTATGLRYQGNHAAGKNGILNSNFSIFQRGTTSTSTIDGYQADRWYSFKSGINITVSQEASALQNLPNCARFQRVSGQTGTASVAFAQMFENAQSITYANQTITISFYARKGADYSAASSLLSWRLITGTGSANNNVFTQGYTSQATTGTGSVTLTTSWQRFSVNVTIPTTTTQMSFYFLTNFVGTAGTNDFYEVTGVQLETASVATAFQTATGTIQGELAACQRYYQLIEGGPFGSVISSVYYGGVVMFPQMRTTPSGTFVQTISAYGFPTTSSTAIAYTVRSVVLYKAANASIGGAYFQDQWALSAEL